MATVPGILVFGEYHLQGGQPPTFAFGTPVISNNFPLNSGLHAMLDRDAMRIVPDDPATGGPVADSLSCWPWYDIGADDVSYSVSSATSTTVTVSPSPGWTTNEWANRFITLLNFTPPFATFGFEQRMKVVSNTGDTITVAGFSPTPSATQVFFLGRGRFTDYHAVAGTLHATELGSPSSRGGGSIAAGGLGVGPDATLLLELYQRVYSTTPYFHLFKQITIGTVVSSFANAPHNTLRYVLDDEIPIVEAAAARRGNTIAWQHCLFDFSMQDVQAAISSPASILNYESRLREVIAWLRGSTVMKNSSAKVTLINHRDDLWAVAAPGGTSYVRGVHKAVAGDTAGVSILDCQTYRIGGDVGEPPNGEKRYYAQAEYFRMGKDVAEIIRRVNLGIPIEQDGGIPVYLMLGDSIFVGQAIGNWTLNSNSDSISGPTPGSLVRPSNQMIWNRQTGQIETYEPHSNSNTSGTLSGNAGPDLSIMAELGDLHPGGFVLIKRAANGAGLAEGASAYDGNNGGRWVKSAEEHYQELLADFNTCVQYINEVLGKQADVRAAMVSAGHNDNQAATGTGGTSFAALLRPFCDDLWADFTTRTSGKKFPILWRRPQSDAAGADPVRIQQVRTALDVQANLESQFRIVDVDGLERDRSDNLHETPETAVVTGRRMVTGLRRVSI